MVYDSLIPCREPASFGTQQVRHLDDIAGLVLRLTEYIPILRRQVENATHGELVVEALLPSADPSAVAEVANSTAQAGSGGQWGSGG